MQGLCYIECLSKKREISIMLITQVAPTPISKELAQASLNLILEACAYPRYVQEDLQIAFDGNFSDSRTFVYAALNIAGRFAKLIEDHEMVIAELQKQISQREATRDPARGPYKGPAKEALDIWSSELPHLLLLRAYLIQRLEQHTSNE